MGQPTSIGRGAHRVWHVNPGPKKKKEKTVYNTVQTHQIESTRLSEYEETSIKLHIFFFLKKIFPSSKEGNPEHFTPLQQPVRGWDQFFWSNPPRAPAAHFHRPWRS